MNSGQDAQVLSRLFLSISKFWDVVCTSLSGEKCCTDAKTI